jgi:hypothetical protein
MVLFYCHSLKIYSGGKITVKTLDKFIGIELTAK